MINAGFLYAIGAAVTWGIVYALDQKILTSLSPLAYLFITSVVSLIILSPFLYFDRVPIKEAFLTGKTTWMIIVASVILGALASFLIFSGIKTLGADDASIIEIAYPFFVVFFSYLIFRTVPNVYFFLGGALIFIGSVIIIKFG